MSTCLKKFTSNLKVSNLYAQVRICKNFGVQTPGIFQNYENINYETIMFIL